MSPPEDTASRGPGMLPLAISSLGYLFSGFQFMPVKWPFGKGIQATYANEVTGYWM